MQNSLDSIVDHNDDVDNGEELHIHTKTPVKRTLLGDSW